MKVQAYFGADIKNVILDALNQAEKEVFIAVYIFNNIDFINALRKCCQRNVKVNLLLNTHENTENNGNFSELVAFGVQLFDYYPIAATERVMHHKFCVIDNQALITGSANWSNAAFSKNDENVLIVENAPDLCGEYVAEFKRISSPLHAQAQQLIQQINDKRNEIINAVNDYANFINNYLATYKTPPPAHLLPAIKPEYIALLPAANQALAPISTTETEYIDENLWRRAVQKYAGFNLPERSFIVVWNVDEEDNEKYGIVNMKGEEVVPCVYGRIINIDYTDGFACVQSNGKWGFVNLYAENGNYEIVVPIYENFSSFWNGLARVKLNGKYGLINTKGETILAHQFEHIGVFSEGLAPVKSGSRWGFVNTEGKMVTRCQFSNVHRFSEGLAAVQSDNKWGYVNTEGKMVIPHQFVINFHIENDRCFKRSKKDPNAGIFAIVVYNSYCYSIIDGKGERLLQKNYTHAECQRRIDELDFTEAE